MNSKERFSNRVEVYVKYRPSYPKEALDYLYETVGLQNGGKVADIGAGTGIFTELLLERGSQVTAVEPNREMREAAASKLGHYPNLSLVPGSAEETGLPEQSVDVIVCAQAFHWFDRPAAQAEFRRILKPGGKAVLIWNTRLAHGTPFREAYSRLLETHGTDYSKVRHKNIAPADLALFFKPGGMTEARFPNGQTVDVEALRGRVISSSYMPLPGDAGYEPMMKDLQRMFDQHQQDGYVHVDYETEVFWGEV
ncbi:methyltransferase domain-containing protein [Xylanibacillus composti]|uniref:Methyltransferase n=1 Tax=Xylanibacillus composti TaxID=1572762 RepID=A0A8J4H416_9BACL|nr:class I SAM-dependent methyltransferase [Xylanibacillus composti]MDT9725372.1 methyltransferase domain-containing protein [Xylanibacillus composti]GIQ69136.1 methyltransferase [Xylanibacillus composti]